MSPPLLLAITIGWIVVACMGTGGALVGFFRRLVEHSVLDLTGGNGRSSILATQRVRLWGKRLGVFCIDLGIGVAAFFALIAHDPTVAAASGLVTAVGLIVNLLWETGVIYADLWSEGRYVALAEAMARTPDAVLADPGALAICEAERARLRTALERMTEDRDRLVRQAFEHEQNNDSPPASQQRGA